MTPNGAYPESSAGYNMVRGIPVAKTTDLAGQVIDSLKGSYWDTVNYIYVVDDENVLKGIVSLRFLFAAVPSTPVEKLMETRLITIAPQSDREEAAVLAVRNTKKAIPVVDEKQRLMGVVPPHKILNIMHEEHIEDLLRLVGIVNHATLVERAWKQVKARSPWLLLGLMGGIMAASIVGFFESALKQEMAIAFFIPLIVYMADAVGTQTETIFIRSLSLGIISKVSSYLYKELKIGLSIGIIFAVISFIFISLSWGKIGLAAIIALSMITTISSAVLIAVFIPWLLFKMKKDPAYGSGPFATVVQDIVSIVFYFIIATAFIGWM
jgi:magnesium transporter